ncbi:MULTISPECIES: ABC transporter ATP-binding protein [unclassified Aureispira]|uniref:ABC transporter ATP-binding protein n=1 Tax=unclassified Aureispira TaxID=2649989 RepID=UPI00069751DF|nr:MULTISPECIES: ABC transporter ATP-binding protein [unclassified Aureispira]WMX16284.1 ABC transporter ATP-binding protein [Aureispira sp. CCB-E]
MSEPNQKYADWPLAKRIIGLAMPYRGIFFLAATLSIILAPISILRPYLVQRTVDDCIINSNGEGLLFMISLLFGVLVLQGILYYIFSYSTSWLGQSVIRDLRTRVFDHINSLRLSYFDKTPIGTSTTRTINDVETINTVFSQGFITIIADILTLLFVLGIMLWTSWKVTLVCLITIPLLVLATYWFKEAVKKAYEVVRTQVSMMNAFLQERITGMRIVQIFNAEEKELENFKVINKKYAKANINSIFYYAIFFPTVEILSATSLGLMVWYGAKGVIGGEVTLGVLVAFPLYIGMLFRPIRILADKFNTLQMGLIVAKRIFKVLDNTNVIENSGSIVPTHLKGDVCFDNVHFSYQQDLAASEIKEWILNGVSFKIKAGETMAIVGSTGAGKSTIINILNRFYETHQGEITIDGLNIKDYELFGLRGRIAVVLQDVFLFSGSVLDNITLKAPHITREEVVEAAKMIGAHPFIEKLPNGYDYQVMERGATLSMGQRQLISFVRALVFNPDILILDEATSSIDPETESIIQYAIEKLIAKRTSIIIAHRLSTIQHADKIMVLEKGKVKEIGSHQELLQIENGHYKEMVETAYALNG